MSDEKAAVHDFWNAASCGEELYLPDSTREGLRGTPRRATGSRSPGTKAYSVAEARELLARFTDVEMRTGLTHADLLTAEAGQRHRGLLLDIAKAVWPRWLFRALVPKLGLFMLITARKPA
jgi:hypothetical protein